MAGSRKLKTSKVGPFLRNKKTRILLIAAAILTRFDKKKIQLIEKVKETEHIQHYIFLFLEIKICKLICSKPTSVSINTDYCLLIPK